MLVDTEVKVADECCIALAQLHKTHPEKKSFSASEILDRLRQEKVHSEVRPGVPPHIYLHNVANLPPNSAKYRMFYRLEDGTYRLLRPGDDSHPDRRGKTHKQGRSALALPQTLRLVRKGILCEIGPISGRERPSPANARCRKRNLG